MWRDPAITNVVILSSNFQPPWGVLRIKEQDRSFFVLVGVPKKAFH